MEAVEKSTLLNDEMIMEFNINGNLNVSICVV